MADNNDKNKTEFNKTVDSKKPDENLEKRPLKPKQPVYELTPTPMGSISKETSRASPEANKEAERKRWRDELRQRQHDEKTREAFGRAKEQDRAKTSFNRNQGKDG